MAVKKDKYVLGQSSSKSLASTGDEIRIDLSLVTKIQKLGATLQGVVRDSNGTPIVGALVNVMDGGFAPLFHAVSGKSGSYFFSNIPVNSSYNIMAIATGKKLKQEKQFSISAKEVKVIDFILENDPAMQLGIIAGDLFKNASTTPISGGVASLYKLNNGAEELLSITHTNKYGQFVFSEVGIASYTIKLRALGHLPESISVAVTAAAQIVSIKPTLQIQPNLPKGTVSGMITDSSNLPVTRADVVLYLVNKDTSLTPIAFTKTDSSGVYLFINVDPGNYKVKSNKTEIEGSIIVPPSDSLTITGSSSVTKGETTLLTATLISSVTDKSITWSTDNSAIATVTSSGSVSGVGGGSVKITATSVGKPSLKDEFTITVALPEVIIVTAGAGTIGAGIGTSMTATLPSSITNKAVTWSSSNTAVATVSASGIVTGVSGGTAIITATSVEKPSVVGSYTMTIIAQAPLTIAISGNNVIKVGSKTPLATNVPNEISSIFTVITESTGMLLAPEWIAYSDTNALNKTIHYTQATSSKEPVINYVFTGHEISYHGTKHKGTAKLKLWIDDDLSTVQIIDTYSATRVTKQTLATFKNLSEDSHTLHVIVLYDKNPASTGYYHDFDYVTVKSLQQLVNWSSANPAIATVSKTGIITGVAVGTTKILLSSIANPSVKGEFTVTVEKAPAVDPITQKDITISGNDAIKISETTMLSATISNTPSELVETITESQQMNLSSDWISYNEAAAHGGKINYATSTPTKERTIDFKFTGTEVTVIGNKHQGMAKIKTWIDNDVSNAQISDAYATSRLNLQKLVTHTGLTNSEHTLHLVVLYDKNPASNNYNYDIDYISVKAPKKLVTWSVEDTTIATVSDMGLVTGLKAGTTKVNAVAIADSTIKSQHAITVSGTTFINSHSDDNLALKKDSTLYVYDEYNFDSLVMNGPKILKYDGVVNSTYTTSYNTAFNYQPKDYWGVGFTDNYLFNEVVYTAGFTYTGGGWFAETPTIEVRQGTAFDNTDKWVAVSALAITPPYPNNDTAGPKGATRTDTSVGTKYTLKFAEIGGNAIRIIGKQYKHSDNHAYTSIAGFEVYYKAPAVNPITIIGNSSVKVNEITALSATISNEKATEIETLTDTDTLTLSSDWKVYDDNATHNNSIHYTIPTASLEPTVDFKFVGHEIILFGNKKSHCGKIKAWIDDNEASAQIFDTYHPTNQVLQELLRFSGLSEGEHFIHIVALYDKNPASNNYVAEIDFFRILSYSKLVTWTVADTTVATVSNTGVVSGLTVGTTKVKATSIKTPSLTSEFELKVTAPTLVNSISNDSLTPKLASVLFNADQNSNIKNVLLNGPKIMASSSDYTTSWKSDKAYQVTDHWGLAFSDNYGFNQVAYTTGAMYFDGGWFIETPSVEVRQGKKADGTDNWVATTSQSIAPAYPSNINAGPNSSTLSTKPMGTTYTFSFDNTWGDAIRIIGKRFVSPDNQHAFTSISGFHVYYK